MEQLGAVLLLRAEWLWTEGQPESVLSIQVGMPPFDMYALPW